MLLYSLYKYISIPVPPKIVFSLTLHKKLKNNTLKASLQAKVLYLIGFSTYWH